MILILTVLEFASPLGFETRPQSDVSVFWLAFFIAILIVEIATVPMICRRPSVGGGLGVLAAILNILQVLADRSVQCTVAHKCSLEKDIRTIQVLRMTSKKLGLSFCV